MLETEKVGSIFEFLRYLKRLKYADIPFILVVFGLLNERLKIFDSEIFPEEIRNWAIDKGWAYWYGQN